MDQHFEKGTRIYVPEYCESHTWKTKCARTHLSSRVPHSFGLPVPEPLPALDKRKEAVASPFIIHLARAFYW